MTQILASGKTGAQRYANNDLSKPVAALDMIQIGQQTQRASEETLGWSYSNEEGSADSQPSSSLKPITAANVGDYDPYLAQIIQTYVANNSYLECSGTANAISLAPRKIADIASPDTTNYSKATSLPFTFRDNLRFTFRATNTNTAATQITIPALAGLSGSIDVVDEAGADLVGGEIIAGKFYEIITTGTSGTKKFILKSLAVPQATEASLGGAKVASQTTANTGTDDLDFITSLKLKTRQGSRYVGRLTASNTTTLGQPLSTGKKYLFRFNNILPSLNASFFTAQYSTDGGATLLSASYKAAISENTSSDALAGYNGKTSGLSLSGIETDGNTGIGNTASRGGLNGEFILDAPSNSTTYKQAHWDNSHYTSTAFNYIAHQTGVGVYEGATTAINYIGFTFKEPNSNTTRGVIASGTIDVWEINA